MRVKVLLATGVVFSLLSAANADPPADPPVEIYDLHTDHLGNIRVVTDSSGQIVSAHDLFPFGEEIMPMQGLTTKLFTGHERDRETGLDYMLARYFGSSLARFLSTDPGDDTDLDVPQSWNQYVYVLNNPLIFNDPDGEVVNYVGATPQDQADVKTLVDQTRAISPGLKPNWRISRIQPRRRS